VSDLSLLEAELRLERLSRRRYAGVAFTLWFLAAVLAAGWAIEARGDSFGVINFAIAVIAMLWLVGGVAAFVMGIVTVLFDK